MLRILLFAALNFAQQTMGASLSFATTNENYPPYTYTNEYGEAQGIYVDIATKVSRLIQMEATVHALPWRRASNAVQNGKIDSLLIAYDTERNRKKFWIRPGGELGTTVYKICTFRDHPLAKTNARLSALAKDVYINTVDGYAYAFSGKEKLDRPTQGIGRSEPHLIQLLINKRVEAILIEASTYKNHPDKDNIYCFSDSVRGATEYIVFSRVSTSEEFAIHFAKAMRDFKQSPEFQILLKRYNLTEL